MTTYVLRGDRLTVDGMRTQTFALPDLAWMLMSKASLPVPLTPVQAAALVADGQFPPEVAGSARARSGATLLLGVQPSGRSLQLRLGLLAGLAPHFRQALATTILRVPEPSQPSRPAAIARLARTPALNGWMLRHLTWAPAPMSRMALLVFGALTAVLLVVGIAGVFQIPARTGPLIAAGVCLGLALASAARVLSVRRREVDAGNWPFAVLAARHEQQGPASGR